jgi:uncharacterized membrane protein YdbT with pleckstrin-like domain
MPIESIPEEQVLDFLRKRALFQDLEEADLLALIARMGEFQVAQGVTLFREGDDGYVYYIVYSGQMRIWQDNQGREVTLGLAEPGDKFGEESLLHNKPRSTNVTALKNTHLLTLDYAGFSWLLANYPQTKDRLRELVNSYQRLRSETFDWLFSGEFIYLITQRHFFDLFDNVWRPMIVIVVSIVLGSLGFFVPFVGMRTILYALGGLTMGAGILWFIWGVVDWRNDYFIITNQRVVWLEQVLFLSDSRQEAPLSAIQSINVHTSQMGRIFGFGDVQIRTFTGTGSLRLTTLRDPQHFKFQIEELILRVRSQNQDARTESMRHDIRTSLGLEMEAEVELPEEAAIPTPDKEREKSFALFTTREMQDNEVLVYHKHPWVLIKRIWLPAVAIFAATLVVPWLAWRDLASQEPVFPTALMSLAVGGLAWLLLAFWNWYVYEDWSNDLYQLSKDSITDREKTPFSSELTRTAPLRNVQSINYNREGIINTILNMGDVNIVVADETLTFENVFNPAHIQQDVIYRLENLKHTDDQKRRQEESDSMLQWLQIYHEVNEEKTRQENGEHAEGQNPE